MKKLVCEMCGSSDMVKQDGMFVCQTCGVKYSLEEAKKMMIEGSVHVDNAHLASNYLSMAKNALDAGNNTEAESYCNKIIEVDPSSFEAWFVKGKAVGWQSTLGHQRISETINAFSNAIMHCPDDEKDELMVLCKEEIENLHKALLVVRMENYMNHPNDNDLKELKSDVQNIIVNSINSIQKAGIETNTISKELGSIIVTNIIDGYKSILSDYTGDDNRPGDYEFKRFVSETDLCIEALQVALILLGDGDTDDIDLYDWRALVYDTMVKFNNMLIDSCSWDYRFNDWGGKDYYKNLSLNNSAIIIRNKQNQNWSNTANKWKKQKKQKEAAEKEKKERIAREQAQKRLDAYWAEHADEKKRFEAECDDLNKQISELKADMKTRITAFNEEMEAIPGAVELVNCDLKIKQLTEKKEALGLFKGKEKKALQDQIDQTTIDRRVVQERIDAKKAEIEDKINSVKAEIQKKIAPLESRVDRIKNELTKPR